MLKPSLNNVLVKVKTKYIRNFTDILRLAAIQNNTSIEQADYVNIVGEVVATPIRISDKHEYRGFTAKYINPGDTAIFSSSVIYDFVQKEMDADPIYKNSVWYDNQEYFNCDIRNLYAVVRDDKIIMQNGYVMLECIEKQSNIYLPQHMRKRNKTTTGTLTKIGYPQQGHRNIDCVPGDTVIFNPNVIAMYQMNNKPFGVLQQRHILGKMEM